MTAAGTLMALVVVVLVVVGAGRRVGLRRRGARQVRRLAAEGFFLSDYRWENQMTTTDTGARPGPDAVGRRAAEILHAIHTDDDHTRLTASASAHATCWSAFNGYPIIDRFDSRTDTGPLLSEAFKVLALKAAVFELSDGDETAADLTIPVPVDEMTHAVLTQQPLVVQLQHRLGIVFVHMAERERFGWEPGDYTEDCYRAAGWGDPPARYWIPCDEWMRRLGILDRRYRSIGVVDCGSSVEIDLGTSADAWEPAR
jgi:hypothetical protein